MNNRKFAALEKRLRVFAGSAPSLEEEYGEDGVGEDIIGAKVKLNDIGKLTMSSPARGWPEDHWVMNAVGEVTSIYGYNHLTVQWNNGSARVSDHIGANGLERVQDTDSMDY